MDRPAVETPVAITQEYAEALLLVLTRTAHGWPLPLQEAFSQQTDALAIQLTLDPQADGYCPSADHLSAALYTLHDLGRLLERAYAAHLIPTKRYLLLRQLHHATTRRVAQLAMRASRIDHTLETLLVSF